MKKIAVITMARNDEFFLNKWITYYGGQFGEENLYIYLDGEDQPVPARAQRANVIHVRRIAEQVVKAEKRRLEFLSKRAAELLNDYDLIIGTDADEFLAVDPNCGKSLAEYLSRKKITSSLSALGIDVGQNTNCEPQLTENQLFLQQRTYAFLSPRYTKPSIIAKPLRWGSGFHRIKGHNFRIDKNMYLFHFGCVDYQMIMQRLNDKDRMATGREKHIRKRFRTINYISKEKKIRTGDRWLKIARIFQTVFRPVYALNKPSMARWRLVVKLPERFKKINI
ncbi:MAG: glycosyltransferase family 2 protein [Prevotellaceae bacterium]|jgi:hypothetical protein|nr:glycosyltransferase family 2 protein [Prevotellaceae bacterium]